MQITQERQSKTAAAPKSNGRKASVGPEATRSKLKQQTPSPVELSAQEREILVAQTAYLLAEKRGFAPGNEWEDWFRAEAEVLRDSDN